MVWASHGLFVSGADFDSTFGLLHPIEKAADIYGRARAMNGGSANSSTPSPTRGCGRSAASSTSRSTRPCWISPRLRRPTTKQLRKGLKALALSQEKKGTIAVSLTNFLDSGCIVASGVALAAWAIAFNFDNVWVSIFGAWARMPSARRWARSSAAFWPIASGASSSPANLLVYATGVFLIMCAVNLPMLCAGIVISGLSVGAGVPSSWSYISEMSSSTSRAANIGISQFAWSCGPAVIFLIALLFSFIFPTFGPDGALLPAGTYGPFDGLFAMRLLFLILFVVALIVAICSASWRSRRTGRKSSPRLRASATPSSR